MLFLSIGVWGTGGHCVPAVLYLHFSDVAANVGNTDIDPTPYIIQTIGPPSLKQSVSASLILSLFLVKNADTLQTDFLSLLITLLIIFA